MTAQAPPFNYVPPQATIYWSPPPEYAGAGQKWEPPPGYEKTAQPWTPPKGWGKPEEWAPPEEIR